MASKTGIKKRMGSKVQEERTDTLAWVLIIIGLLFFADKTIDIDFGILWPLLLVAVGVKMIWK